MTLPGGSASRLDHYPEDIAPVRVHIAGSDLPAPSRSTAERVSTARTVILDNTAGTGPLSRDLANHSPNRKQITLTIIGQSTDVAWIARSKGEAQGLNGAIVMGGMVITLNGTDEWHCGVAAGTSIRVGVVQETV